ncbi:hypothetical protein O9G_003601 [Rozella allomycis CSF55]|uniref:Secreted protein n=1 Tax=Rozella allomycis (strain CSF55) TaxID=988480 RepID=A0A075APA9_ROZAC|nr:hypothetical protein O9G_003601 [Rozella allomycis CSF55]|eukprot:EPZ31891.1 hypothetical protein O9G_003601 [Rozella allomycis CSF55]
MVSKLIILLCITLSMWAFVIKEIHNNSSESSRPLHPYAIEETPNAQGLQEIESLEDVNLSTSEQIEEIEGRLRSMQVEELETANENEPELEIEEFTNGNQTEGYGGTELDGAAPLAQLFNGLNNMATRLDAKAQEINNRNISDEDVGAQLGAGFEMLGEMLNCFLQPAAGNGTNTEATPECVIQ